MPKNGITGHMVVKNEDQWVWFAIQSVLPYVDQLLVTDTGSVDNTISIIQSMHSTKIKFNQVKCETAGDVTAVRRQQIDMTDTPWIWVVDGDEIYPHKTCEEISAAVGSRKYSTIVVRRYDLLGDIYHRQHESVGTYNLYGQSGHLLVRLNNKDLLKGLNVRGDYPLEGYFDGDGRSVLDEPKEKVYITDSYLYHSMYLKRSSKGSNLGSMFNRSKYKIEKGIPVHDQYPEVFALGRPPGVPNPLFKRNLVYEVLSSVITPVKNLKRKFL